MEYEVMQPFIIPKHTDNKIISISLVDLWEASPIRIRAHPCSYPQLNRGSFDFIYVALIYIIAAQQPVQMKQIQALTHV